MTSVVDDPTARLYAGALLGKSLTKELGQLGASQDMDAASLRRATLTAGVASGKIKPGQLSIADAALLGQGLNKAKVPSVVGDPLGFLGGLAGNFAKGAGQFAESLKGVPTALYNAALAPEIEGIGHNVFGAAKPDQNKGILPVVKALPKAVAHDFSSPQQIYENPFNPVLDVAGAFSAGAGLASKAAITARSAKAASYLARTGEQLGPPAGLTKKLIDLSSPTGRRPGVLSPGFGSDQVAEGVSPALFPRQYATGRPFTKYAIQKPMDWTVGKLQQLPTVGPKLQDFEAKYYSSKLGGKTHGQVAAGSSESFTHHEGLDDLIGTLRRVNKKGQPAGQMQFEAMILHSMGINDLNKLDEYAAHIRKGEDVDGVIMTPDMQKAAQFRSDTLYQDPHFRELIERPTPEMKEMAFHMRRMNVDTAQKLEQLGNKNKMLDPEIIQDAAFGRLRELTGKTNEELISEMKPSMRPQSAFAKGLHVVQQSIMGEPIADVAPTIHDLAMNLPYGKMAEREDLINRAIESLKQDVEGVGHAYDRAKQRGYLQGNNLFQKIGVALHDEMGVAPEEAQAFARGIALGAPDGPILPTYVPSVSGERLKFGVRPDKLTVKLGRALGVSRFKPLGESLPGFYDWDRPFVPRSISAQTIGRGERMHFTEKATYGSFQRGAMRIDPETIIQNAYRINKDIVVNKLNPTMLEKVNVPNPDRAGGRWTGPAEALTKLGNAAEHYSFVPVDTYRNYLTSKSEMEILTAKAEKDGGLEAELEKLAEESAHKLVKEETERAAHGNTEGLVLPKNFIRTVIEHARISEQTTGWGKFASSPVAVWKTAVLSFSPAWLARTSIGHGLLALVDGTTNPMYWQKSHEYFMKDRPISTEAQTALKRWNNAGDRVLNPEPLPYGVNQGGMQQELSDIQGGPKHMGDLLVPKTISAGVHKQNNFQRRAVFLRKLDIEAKQRMAELGIAFDHPGGFMDSRNIDAVMDPEFRKTVLKYPELPDHAFDQLSKVSYTFSQMAPWERKLVRYGMPFYGWYKFISKFVWSMPINYPGRAAAIAAVGKLGMEEKESDLGPMPDYLSGALFFNHSDLSKARYINLYGLNPAADIANPLGKAGLLSGSIALGRTSPIIQAVLAGFGINPLTGEPEGIDPASGIEKDRFGHYIDTKTGQPVNLSMVHAPQRILGSFLRSFPEFRTAELAITGGNPVYPESIPLVDEHPIGVNPQTRRSNTPESILWQELGVQPREMDLTKYHANLLKSWREATKKNVKAQARQQEKLAAPNP